MSHSNRLSSEVSGFDRNAQIISNSSGTEEMSLAYDKAGTWQPGQIRPRNLDRGRTLSTRHVHSRPRTPLIVHVRCSNFRSTRMTRMSLGYSSWAWEWLCQTINNKELAELSKRA